MYPQENNIVLNLIHRSIRELCSQDYTVQQIESIIQLYNSSFFVQKTVIVAEQKSQIIGVVKAQPHGYQTQLIEALFTHPNFVHQGIGEALIEEIERRARNKHIKKLIVFSSLTAVDFYLALGYKYIKKTTIHINIPCVLLKKQLKPFTMLDRISSIILIAIVLACIFIYYY